MTRAEAIAKLSVAFGLCREEIIYQIAAMGRLETQKRKSDEASSNSMLLPSVSLANPIANPMSRPTLSLTK